MYVLNGIVYASEPSEDMKITAAKALDDMIMILTFSTGETRLFDATELTGPVFEPLKDDAVFRNFRLVHGAVTWMNGEIDCSPEYMYDHSYEYISPEAAV
ncbi:MAG: DUF2442 domain-containing protein [Clostridiales bacterium]|nr:DUF2442 domain-containing protein [Clostridiales bacterium]